MCLFVYHICLSVNFCLDTTRHASRLGSGPLKSRATIVSGGVCGRCNSGGSGGSGIVGSGGMVAGVVGIWLVVVAGV